MLKITCTSLNPRFELIKSAQKLAKFVKIDYIDPHAHSGLKISMVERNSMRERILDLKEEVGILAYMRRNGLEK